MDEDNIISYKVPKILALKRPTWEVNPTRKIDDFKLAFYTDLGDAMMRFACTPTFASDAFFKQKEKLEKCMNTRNPLDSFRRFDQGFKPDPEKHILFMLTLHKNMISVLLLLHMLTSGLTFKLLKIMNR